MFQIIGIVVVFGMVFGGFSLAGGHFDVIIKALPFEMMMIGGAAVGAFLVCGALIVLAGLWKPLGRWVSAIPAPLANAMLAGVLLGLCLAPVKAVAAAPLLGVMRPTERSAANTSLAEVRAWCAVVAKSSAATHFLGGG